VKPYVEGQNLGRYSPIDSTLGLIYPYDEDADILPENVLTEEFESTYQYLERNRSTLEDRGGEGDEFDTWYAHWRQRHPDTFEREKIIVAQIVNQGQATYDDMGETYYSNMLYSPGIDPKYDSDSKAVLGILNSSLVWYYISNTSSVLRGGYYRYTSDYLSPVSFPLRSGTADLNEKVDTLLEYKEGRSAISTELLDYLGNYADGEVLFDCGFYQPEASPDSFLNATTRDYDNIRIGTVETERKADDTVVIRVTARYKPDDEDAHETDQWGYTETEPMPAMRLTELSKTEADLVEAFVPVAVEKADGFAGFRETATKTNSLVDRLEAITLPDPDDVAEDLERYREAVERAEELDEKIQRTDDLIDKIVYDLYGLTDEEIEIVEQAGSE
jgi:hypothetical protein